MSKKELHPKDYRYVVFSDEAAGFSFLTKSTATSDETIKWEDGNEYPLVKVQISSASHPFFTGEEKIIDTEGRVDRFKARAEKAKKLKEALAHFTGRIKQTPPMYSAIKKDGVRLYRLAREGKTAEIPSRDIEIYSIDVLKSLNEDFEFVIDTHVSKGTYIRSLARDIGEYLGCGATLAGLERTYASGFNISECMPLDKLSGENIGEYILSEEKAVSYLPKINVTEKQAVRFSNGGQLGFDRLRLDLNKVTENELFRVKFGEKLLGIGFADCERAQIGIKCILNYPE